MKKCEYLYSVLTDKELAFLSYISDKLHCPDEYKGEGWDLDSTRRIYMKEVEVNKGHGIEMTFEEFNDFFGPGELEVVPCGEDE